MFKKLIFWEAIAAIVGTVIGAGVFVLPHTAVKAGLSTSLIWLLFLGLAITYIHLLFGEIVLRTKNEYRLPGYVGHYLGQPAKKFLLITNFLTFAISLLIYLILGAKFLNILFQNLNLSESFWVLVLWLISTVVILFDNKLAGRINFYLSFALIGLFVVLSIYCLPHIQNVNFNLPVASSSNWLIPYGIFFYALIGISAIPEAIQLAKGKISGKNIKKIILIGSLIPIAIYFLFILSTIGAVGARISQEAITSLAVVLGPNIAIIGALVGLLAVITSYLIFGHYLKNSFIHDYRWPKWLVYIVIALCPILAYFFLAGKMNLITLISFVGALVSGFEGIMILFVARQAKKQGDRDPEYKLPLPKPIFWFLAGCFVAGAISQIIIFVNN